jgi:gamma-glutamylcyclotransferase (GGCT)/AIG2-like uncharacterized protein YtfP
MKKRLFLMFIATIFIIGCSESTTNSEDPNLIFIERLNSYVMPNITNTSKEYDYYEIADSEILYSAINIDYANVLTYLNESDLSYNSTIYEIDTNHNIYNEALDINETKDCMIFYQYDPLTNVTAKATYVKDYGLYEVRKDICVVNSDIDNCSSYLYVSY